MTKRAQDVLCWQVRMVFADATMPAARIPSCMDLMQDEINDLRALLAEYEDKIYPKIKQYGVQLVLDL